MTDYDPKSIPILDDVIDLSVDEDERRHTPTIRHNEVDSAQAPNDDNLDLFKAATEIIEEDTGKPIDLSTFIEPMTDMTPPLGAMDEVTAENTPTEPLTPDATTDRQIPDSEEQAYESALIDYPENLYDEEIANATGYEKPVDAAIETTQPEVELTSGENIEPPSIQQQPVPEPITSSPPAIDIQPLIDDIVERLLPVIEQQVRHHVEQALQDNINFADRQRSETGENDEAPQE